MSIKYTEDGILDIFIPNELIGNVDFKDKLSLENYLRKLFKRLKDNYNVVIEGFYDINIYIDKYYGICIHLEEDYNDYYEYKNQVDMRVVIEDKAFLYKVDDIPSINKFDVLNIDNNIYLRIKEKLNKKEMMYLIENSEIKTDI